jgi:hypothetical protein
MLEINPFEQQRIIVDQEKACPLVGTLLSFNLDAANHKTGQVLTRTTESFATIIWSNSQFTCADCWLDQGDAGKENTNGKNPKKVLFHIDSCLVGIPPKA